MLCQKFILFINNLLFNDSVLLVCKYENQRKQLNRVGIKRVNQKVSFI